MFGATSFWFGIGIPFVEKRQVIECKKIDFESVFKKMSKTGTEFDVLIQDYSECQQQILCGLNMTMLFYVAQYRNDVPLMEYALRQGCEKTVRDETLLDIILDIFDY